MRKISEEKSLWIFFRVSSSLELDTTRLGALGVDRRGVEAAIRGRTEGGVPLGVLPVGKQTVPLVLRLEQEGVPRLRLPIELFLLL